MSLEQLPREHGFEPKHWVVDSFPEEADRMAQAIAHELKALGWSEDEMGKVEVIVGELVANGIKHGNHGDPKKKVTIDMSIEKTSGGPDDLVIAVSDEGEGFDKTKIPDPTADEGLSRTSGRGLFMAGMWMDSVEVVPGQGKVIVRKKRQAETDGIT
jgi:serine/threonine-protein kinase RsbW